MNSSCPSPVQLTPAHDKALAKQFLSTLDPATERFTFQFFSDGDDGYAEVFHGTLDKVWPKVLALNTPERRIGFFVTINETDFGGRRTENVVRARALFVDADGHDQVQRCRDAIHTTGAQPTMVVCTSAGRAHFYWRCDDLPRDQFTPLQAALIAKLGTDPAVKDLPRVMRLPGTLHLKDSKVPGKVTLLTSGRLWNVADLSAQLGLCVTSRQGRTC
jgi:putative DNA primase/helicase